MLLYPCIISKHGGCSRIVAFCLLSLVKELLGACNGVLFYGILGFILLFCCGSCVPHFSSCNGFYDEIFMGPKRVRLPAMNGVLLCALYSVCQGHVHCVCIFDCWVSCW